MTEMNAMSVEIAKLSVKNGDLLVLKCDSSISSEQADRIRVIMKPHLPDGVKMLVLDKSLHLSVLTREEIETKSS